MEAMDRLCKWASSGRREVSSLTYDLFGQILLYIGLAHGFADSWSERSMEGVKSQRSTYFTPTDEKLYCLCRKSRHFAEKL